MRVLFLVYLLAGVFAAPNPYGAGAASRAVEVEHFHKKPERAEQVQTVTVTEMKFNGPHIEVTAEHTVHVPTTEYATSSPHALRPAILTQQQDDSCH